MSDRSAKFDALDALFDKVPFFKCPQCGRTDSGGSDDDLKTGTFFTVVVPCEFREVEVDDPLKTLVYDQTDFTPSFMDGSVRVYCDHCGHRFPLPKGWKLEPKR